MNREMESLIEKELAKHPGVESRFERGTKHPRVVLKVGTVERFFPFTGTRTDRRGMLNNITALRRLCRELGA